MLEAPFGPLAGNPPPQLTPDIEPSLDSVELNSGAGTPDPFQPLSGAPRDMKEQETMIHAWAQHDLDNPHLLDGYILDAGGLHMGTDLASYGPQYYGEDPREASRTTSLTSSPANPRSPSSLSMPPYATEFDYPTPVSWLGGNDPLTPDQLLFQQDSLDRGLPYFPPNEIADHRFPDFWASGPLAQPSYAPCGVPRSHPFDNVVEHAPNPYKTAAPSVKAKTSFIGGPSVPVSDFNISRVGAPTESGDDVPMSVKRQKQRETSRDLSPSDTYDIDQSMERYRTPAGDNTPSSISPPPYQHEQPIDSQIGVSTVRTNALNRKRKSRSNKRSTESASHSVGIQIVQEDGKGGAITCTPGIPAVARARRLGPLSLDGRRNAAMRRKDRTVCLWCRLAKKKCSGEDPCQTCIEQTKVMIIEQPCVRADFIQVVESGTCNYISQRAVNHLTLDGSTRRRLELPPTFEMDRLLSSIGERRGQFNVRVRLPSGKPYILDLNESYNYLKDLYDNKENGCFDLKDFIDSHVLKFNGWQKCVKGCDPKRDVLSLLSQWNNMPSRAGYDFVAVSEDTPDRPMNIDDLKDQGDIVMAAQLSRIFCRKLEVDGYRKLQFALNKNKWDDVPYESFLEFISQLGHILVTLRWRVSWWEALGDGGTKPDINKERYEERVRSLCRTLYFYYTSVKLKLPAWAEPTGIDGVWSTYADSSKVWDDFPCMATIEGFETWMSRGRQLINEAGMKGRTTHAAEGPKR